MTFVVGYDPSPGSEAAFEVAIGLVISLVGVVVMLWWRWRDGRFWSERAGVVDPAAMEVDA